MSFQLLRNIPFDATNQVSEVLYYVAGRPVNVLIIGTDKTVLLDLLKLFYEDYESEFVNEMCLKVENGGTIKAALFEKCMNPLYGKNDLNILLHPDYSWIGYMCERVLFSDAMYFVALKQNVIRELITCGPPNKTPFYKVFVPFFEHSGQAGFDTIKEKLKRLENI